MTNLRKVPLPRAGSGPVTWEGLQPYLDTVLREVLGPGDVRNPVNDFATGLVASDDGDVTLGAAAYPSGRVAAIPTLFTYIGDAGRAASQRFAYPVQTANKNSVQSSSTVLTAASGALTSTISIASHSVKFDFGSVAYSSGSITGLDPETLYLVYADDPEYAGGAVTYLATENPDNVIATGRYYLGYITTPILGNGNVISAASNAAAAELTTTTDHGWSSGQSVAMTDFAGGTWTTLNGNSYTITVTGLDTFTIPVDSLGFGTYTASSGTATRETSSTQSGGGAGGGSGGGGSAGTRWDGLTQIP